MVGDNNNLSQNDIFSMINYSFENDIKNVITREVRSGFIVEAGINLFVASAGSGKTLLMHCIAIDFMKSGRDVVYVDFDNPADLPAARGFVEAIEYHNLVDKIKYLNSTHYDRYSEIKTSLKQKYNYKTFLEDIFNSVSDNSVLFIDSVQNFIDTNDVQKVMSFMLLMRKFSNKKNITICMIHHVSKSLGRSKGHTQLEDMSDAVYSVSSQKRVDGFIESWILKAVKQRYISKSELTIKLRDYYVIDVEDVLIEDNTVKSILRFVVSYIRKVGDRVKQSDLKDEIKKHFQSVGNNRILEILKDFTKKGLFIEEQGLKNTKYYSVNETSEYLKILFDTQLSQTKIDLINLINLKFEDDEVVNITVNNVEYKTVLAIKRNVYKMRDDEAETVLKELKKMKNVVDYDDVCDNDDSVDF